MAQVKEHRLYQHYPSGAVVFRGLSTDPNHITELKERLEAKDPTAVFEISKVV